MLSYKRLRGDDAAPGSASAYRITVCPPTHPRPRVPAQADCCCPMPEPWLASVPFSGPVEGRAVHGGPVCAPAPLQPRPTVCAPLSCPCPPPPLQVRQLEALVRLSEALARLHLCEVVGRDHVKEVGAQSGTSRQRRTRQGVKDRAGWAARPASSALLPPSLPERWQLHEAPAGSSPGGAPTRRRMNTPPPRPSPAPLPQAYRLVKNSIINVEQPDQELADEDVLDDAAEVEHMVRGPAGRAGARAEPPGGAPGSSRSARRAAEAALRRRKVGVSKAGQTAQLPFARPTCRALSLAPSLSAGSR